MTRLIEPWIARSVARRLTGDAALKGSYLMERLHADLETSVPLAESLVGQASGIPAPPPVRWLIIDRADWADANIKGLSALLSPLGDRLSARLESTPGPARAAQRAVISAEVGFLLGYVSRRVLGQYDLLVTEGDLTRGTGSAGPPEQDGTGSAGPPEQDGTKPSDPSKAVLYFVGPNIVETERRFGFVPEEFALWVALHEVTHRFQFDGVPWLRERFFGLLRSYLESVNLDARGLAKRLAAAGRRMMDPATPPEEKNPVYLLASEQQRSALDEMQALMAVIEGHGNFVMDHVGAQVIPSFRRMRRVFDQRRRQTSAIQRAVNHVIGLELKLRQYELGQRFCEAVVADSGHEGLARIWSDPDRFPSLDELRRPETWLARVA